jgi:hypothetical protein
MTGQEPQSQSRPPFAELRRNVNVLLGCCQCLSSPLEIWFRRFGSCGELYFGHHAMIGLLIVPFWMIFHPDVSPGPLLDFWALTGLLLVFHRVGRLRRESRGERVHSRFAGASRLQAYGGNLLAQRFWEPLTAIVAGLLIHDANAALGSYLAVAGVALALVAGAHHAAGRSAIRRMEDARAEQEWLMSHMRH